MNTKLTINVSKELLESFRKIVGQRNVGKTVEQLMLEKIKKEKFEKLTLKTRKIARYFDNVNKGKSNMRSIIQQYKSERN